MLLLNVLLLRTVNEPYSAVAVAAPPLVPTFNGVPGSRLNPPVAVTDHMLLLAAIAGASVLDGPAYAPENVCAATVGAYVCPKNCVLIALAAFRPTVINPGVPLGLTVAVNVVPAGLV